MLTLAVALLIVYEMGSRTGRNKQLLQGLFLLCRRYSDARDGPTADLPILDQSSRTRVH